MSDGLVWVFFFRIYVDLAIFQPYLDLEAGDNQSLRIHWRGRGSNPGSLASQAKSLTTRPTLPHEWRKGVTFCLERIFMALLQLTDWKHERLNTPTSQQNTWTPVQNFIEIYM